MRPERTDEIKAERRRRTDNTLDRMTQLKLALPPEFRDDKNHQYYWANDVGTRIYDLTKDDDYDHVTLSKAEASENDRVRRPVGQNEDGSPIYAYLLRKPMEYHLADRAEKDAVIKEQQDQLLRKPGGLAGSEAAGLTVHASSSIKGPKSYSP